MSSSLSTNSVSANAAPSGVSQALYLMEPGDAGVISPTDVIQGSIGDCFLLAAIAEEAYWEPSLISSAIHDNGDGTQAVKLYSVTGYSAAAQPIFAAAPVTVVDATLSSGGAQGLMVNGVTEIWTRVLEAAYAQANGGYGAIGNGGYPSYAMMQLTGGAASSLNPDQVTEADLLDDQAAGDLITLDTSATGSLPYSLINGHAYFYEGLRTVNGTDYVAAGNPWGYDQPALIPVSELSSAFLGIDVGRVPASTPDSTSVAPVRPTTPGGGLVINVSEDAWQGDAQFTVTVDGSQVGGTRTATASHAAGQSQAITLTGILTTGLHQIGINFINDAYGGPGADRNLYVTGASYNGTTVADAPAPMYANGTDAFEVVSTTPNPTPSAGLVVDVSEDAWQGDAQFNVTIDGSQIGGVFTATSSHAAGQSQAVTLQSVLAPGFHAVGISFINDAYGGSSSMDRNLYVTGASYNGEAISGAGMPLYGNGTDTFGVTSGTPVTSMAIVNISEDAWEGDAQFTVAIDGKQFGSTYTATTSHATGQSQAFAITGIPETFSAHDLAVTFLNDAYGGSSSTDRNLYVNSVTFDRQAVPGTAATLFGNGTQHFTMQAPSNYTG